MIGQKFGTFMRGFPYQERDFRFGERGFQFNRYSFNNITEFIRTIQKETSDFKFGIFRMLKLCHRKSSAISCLVGPEQRREVCSQ